MDNQEIKDACERCYAEIKAAEDHLKWVRSICKHESTFEGNYSYRVGASFPALICSFCNDLIKPM